MMKYSKWLVPVLAFLVIIESVFIVKKLSGNEQSWQMKKPDSQSGPSETSQVTHAVLKFEGENVVQAEQEQELKIIVSPEKDLLVDGTDIWVEYESEYLEVFGTDASDRFSEVGRNWIEPNKNRVLVTLVELDQAVKFSKGENERLLTLNYRPKKTGKTELKIVKKETGGTNIVGLGEEYSFQVEDFKLRIE